MKQSTCSTCVNYRRHYAFDKREIFRVYCGHCTCLKVRKKKPDALACEHYTESAPDIDAFATKEYLSKELLQYLLHLELLPKIEDMEE